MSATELKLRAINVVDCVELVSAMLVIPTSLTTFVVLARRSWKKKTDLEARIMEA